MKIELNEIQSQFKFQMCGLLKGDYRYSNTIVYNNFIFPDPTEKQKRDIEKKHMKY